MDVNHKIDQGVYDAIAQDYDKSKRSDRFVAQNNARKALQADLEAEHFANPENVARPKLDRLFEIAWDHGHSMGYSQVVGAYEEFVDLVK